MRRLSASVLVSLCLLLASAQAVSAHSQDEKVFEAIPQHLRARLVERLALYVKYERAKQFDKLYDLLWESLKATGQEEREAYVNASQKAFAEGYRSILLEFKPTGTLNISLDDNDTGYEVWGDAKATDGKHTYRKDAAIQARFINGDWYFSSVADVVID